MESKDALKHDERVEHAEKGLGTVVTRPDDGDVEVAGEIGPDTVYVKWDDDRFPVEAVPRSELEKVPDAAAAISTGF